MSPHAPTTDAAAPRSTAPDAAGAVQRSLQQRAQRGWNLAGPDVEYLDRIRPVLDFMLDRYFRVETRGWERLPERASLLIGIHSGTWLTMDAWALVFDWWRHFGTARPLHGTAHDALMAMPVLGPFFRKVGVVPAARESVTAALGAGHDVVVWPGGEVDAMRTWKRRNEVDFARRRGFVKQAILSGVPIVPVATVGGPDTVFVLSEGRWLARALHLKKLLRAETMPIVAGLPFGIWPELLPSHIPLPSKIVSEFLEPVAVSRDVDRVNDDRYVNRIFDQVQDRVQKGVARLAAQRRLPVIG